MPRNRSPLRRLLVLSRRFTRSLTGGWTPYIERSIPAKDLGFTMKQQAIPSLGFFLMLSMSAVIATLGLMSDSAPAIIGAMIIAPLMAPIVSSAFGIAAADWKLVRLSVTTMIAGTAVVIAIGFLGVEAFGLRIAGDEILARTAPSFLDLGVAIAAGCAGAFAQTRLSIANSIAGVAIAVALVPPLAVTGIGLSLGRKATSSTGLSLSEFGLYFGGSDIAAGAFLLFVTNLSGIVVIAATVFIAQGYGRWPKALLFVFVLVVVSAFLTPSLNRALKVLYAENRVMRLYSKRAVDSGYSRTAKIDRFNVSYRGGILHVSVDMFTVKGALRGGQDKLDDFRMALEEELGEPVVIEIDVIPIDVLHYRSARPQIPQQE